MSALLLTYSLLLFGSAMSICPWPGQQGNSGEKKHNTTKHGLRVKYKRAAEHSYPK